MPIWKHSQVSLERYADEVGLDASVRASLMSAFIAHDTRSLGEFVSASRG